MDLDLVVEVSRSHSDTIHAIGLVWTSERPVALTLPGKTKYLKETEIHATGGIFLLKCFNPVSVYSDTSANEDNSFRNHIH